jgi:hypothetical protein
MHPSAEVIAELRSRVAETFAQGARVLEHTAALADSFAEQKGSEGDDAYAARERAEAAKARDSAARLLAHAERLRSGSQ